jgi:RNA ligase
MKIDLQKFEELVELKYLNKQRHNVLDLLIWNYTNKCSIEDYWTEETLQARGLITDLDGNIISRPMKKFFNLNQRPEDSIKNLPFDTPVVYEKLDGSMGIQYYDSDNVCIATRGSFNSDQAIHATKFMEKFVRNDFNQEYTYIYEVLYEQNRIVVNYGNRNELILIAVVNTKTGEEIDPISEAKRLGVPCPKIYDFKTVEDIAQTCKDLPGDQEGFVVKYKNNYRVKIKGIEYIRLHRLITGFSTKSIWECLMNGDSFDEVLTNVPDEFFKWTMEKKKDLEDKFNNIRSEVSSAFTYLDPMVQDRKEQAIWIMENHKNISGELFSLLDGKPIEKIIWKKLKPKYELPFFNQSES